jgi:hypothetical protein
VTSCARPGCAEPAAGTLLLHRSERVAELLTLDDPTGQRYGVGLCAEHMGRAKAPTGWELIDRTSSPTPATVSPVRPRVHGSPGSATNPGRPIWLPSRSAGTEEVSELRTARSPLLRRAFQGDVTDKGQIEGQQRLLV